MPEPGRDPGPPLGYYREDTHRIARAVRQYEATAVNAPGLSPRTPVINGGPIPAYTSGSIAAGSKTSPTSGSVTLAVPGTGNALADGSTVTMWNYSTRALTTGKLVFLTYFNGRYVFLVGDC